MCLVSFVGDHYSSTIPYKYPWATGSVTTTNFPEVSKQEFEDLKAEVLEMKKFLELAKGYDVKNNEPDCKTEEKFKLLREIAKLVGVELEI